MTQPLPMVRRLLALPAWAWVGAIVGVGFAVRAWLARGMDAPFVMVDELIYSELAKSFASSGELLVRDEPSGVYGVLYPILISPAYLLFDRVPDAYAAVKTINALVMSLAAVPAYALARRVLSRAGALGAAALAVAIPSLAYTATVMTENLFYPLFLTTAWALVLVLERPDRLRVTLLLAVVVAAFATRAQALALLPAIVTAPLLLVALRGRGLRELRPFASLYASIAALGIAAVVVQAARGRSPLDVLGAYEVVGRESYDVGRVLRFWLWHVEELDLYLGVAPVIALLVLLGIARRQPQATQAFLAATVALVFWTSLVVAAFASRFADRIEERNLFYVAPLVLIALLVWVERGAPRPVALVAPAALVAVGLPLLFPYGRFLGSDVVSDTLALIPLRSDAARLLFDSVVWTVGLAAVAVAVLMLLVPARYAAAVPLVVFVYFLAVDRSVLGGPNGFEQAGAGALRTGIGAVRRDWIDAAVPPSATVAAIWSGRLDRLTINENELFNRRVGPVYYLDRPTPGGLPEQPLRIGEDGVVRGFAADYVLVDSTGSFEPAGERVARDTVTGMTLWRVRPPLATTVTVRGLHPGDTWSGRTVVYERRRCGGTLHVALTSDPRLFAGATTVTAVSGPTRRAVRFAPTGGATLRIPLSARGPCTVRFTVSPTAIPQEVVPGSSDARVLGAHFNAFWVE